MTQILIAVVSVSVIGALSAVILTAASKVMAVEVDERFPTVRAELPGANCGACGYAGCDAYAQGLIDDETVKTNLCTPGGQETAVKLSEVLGRAFEEVAERVAVVKCSGISSKTSDKVEFQGYDTCRATKLFYGGRGACTYGCIGCGDCKDACAYDAIDMVDGIARIDPRYCVACTACVSACPSKVIMMVAKSAPVVIGCNSCDKGAVVRKICTIGCIACKKCEKECPDAAITIVNNLAVIDYEKCTGCGHCAEICITGCIAKL